MIEIGRLVVKLAGRDAGLKGVVVEILDKGFVLIDGQVRRRKCNVIHLEPLDKIIEIPKNANHEDVIKAFKAEGIEVAEKRKKKTPKTEKPVKQRKTKAAEEKSEDPKLKKAEKKKK
jgi:large subunit ribosomal protein L14e